MTMIEPRRIWWTRPRKLCGLERPGGGGRAHRVERRRGELAWLRARGVRLIVSVSPSRHNLEQYARLGVPCRHLPVAATRGAAEALDTLLPLLRTELRERGAVAVHGDYRTDFVAAVCAAHLHEANGVDPAEGLARAAAAGLHVTPAACELLGVAVEDERVRGPLVGEAGGDRG
jgi:hypothetical protein